MPRGKKTKPKTKTVLDLNAFKEQFTAPGNDGQKSQVFVEKKDSGMDWTMEDDPGTPKYEVIDLPSAPRAERINYDESRLDMSQEIFEIRISPLPYDVDSESLRRFFDILEDCEIVSLDIPKGGDDERYSGQAFLKVNSLNALSACMSKDGEVWQNGVGLERVMMLPPLYAFFNHFRKFYHESLFSRPPAEPV